MDCRPYDCDSLSKLLIRYPPSFNQSKSQKTNTNRRLASFFGEKEFCASTSPKLQESKKSLKTQMTKELINELLTEIKEEKKSEINVIKEEEIHETPINKGENIDVIELLRNKEENPPPIEKTFVLPLKGMKSLPLRIEEYSHNNNNNNNNDNDKEKHQNNQNINNNEPTNHIPISDFSIERSPQELTPLQLIINPLNSNELSSLIKKPTEIGENDPAIENSINKRYFNELPSLINIPTKIEENEPAIENHINKRYFSFPSETPPYEIIKEQTSPNQHLKKKTILEQSFHINRWGELQTMLKNEYNLLNQENELRTRLLSEIRLNYMIYYKNYLKLKDFKDLLYGTAQTPKVFIEDSKRILRDMKDNVHELLHLLRQEPRKLAHLISKQRSKGSILRVEALLETFCRTFFEDLSIEEPYQLIFLRFLDEIIKLEIEGIDKIEQVSQKLMGNGSLIEKIFNHLTANDQCEKYLRFLLKNPLISIIKTRSNLEINPSKIYGKLTSRRRTESYVTKTPSSIKIKTPLTNSPVMGINRPNDNLRASYNDFYKDAFEEKGEKTGFKSLFNQQIEDERTRFRNTLSPFLSYSARNFSYFSKKNESMVNTINDSVFEETESSFTNNDSFIKQDSRIQRKTMCPPESYNYIKTELDDDNSEVIEILEANINEIKNLLNIFLDSIFSTIYNLPLHIRLFLKLIEKRINEKFTIAKEDLHLIFSNFIFLKWIIPKFSMPVFTSLGFDTEFKNSQMKNLMLLGGILHKIVKLSFYDNSASDFIPFNDFIEENKVYMKEYYDEVVNIGDNIVELINGEEQTNNTSIKIHSVFLSLEDVATICEFISNDSYEFIPEIKALIAKILGFDEHNKLFHKLFQVEGFVPLIKPSEIFFNCLEINDSTLSYQQLLFGESPDKNDDLMFFSKVKSLMRKLLISVDKVNTIYTLTGRENVHISEILEIYQEKTHIYDCTQLKIKVPIQTTAKFLENCIGFLDISYKANNWKSIYEGVLSDFEERAIKFKDLSLETKTFLATGLENIEKMKSSMQNAIERVSKFELVKFLNEKFIKGLKFPICLTSKNMRISVLESFRKKIDKKKALALEEAFYNGDLMLLNQDECIHKKMDEAGAHVFLFEEKKTIKEAKKSSRRKKLGEKEVPTFHCENIQEFLEALCSINEVRESMIEGDDNSRINETLALYIDSLEKMLWPDDEKERKEVWKEFNIKDRDWLIASKLKEWSKRVLEKSCSRKLYLELFPKNPTYKDAALYSRIKVYDWIDYSHLDIKEKNRLDMMWNAAGQNFKKIDLANTPIGKLKSMTECFTTIIDSLTLASNKNEGAGADDSLPILIYVILKALPTHLHSNINFVKLFCHPKCMFSQAGYSFTQIQSAISFIENLNPDFINVKQEEFVKIIKEKEKQYDIFFEKQKNKINENSLSDIIILNKI